jgi:hypothetical protein
MEKLLMRSEIVGEVHRTADGSVLWRLPVEGTMVWNKGVEFNFSSFSS